MRYLPLIVIGVIGVSLLGGLLLSSLIRHKMGIEKSSPTAPAAPPPVKVIVNPPERPGAGLMSEAGAVISDDKTIITQSYPLGQNALISLSNVTGHISIE